MNIKEKQRLVGAVVLLTIIAIFFLLSFYKVRSSNNLSMITIISHAPNKNIVTNLQLPSYTISFNPSLKEKPIQKASFTPTVTSTSWKLMSGIAITDKFRSLMSEPNKLKIIKKSYSLKLPPTTLKEWTIQVASFSNHDNAIRLLQQLRSNGLNAYLQEKHEGNIITRVFVGPHINYKKIDKIQKKLQRWMRLNSIIKKCSLSVAISKNGGI